jgi:hypothetical protein
MTTRSPPAIPAGGFTATVGPATVPLSTGLLAAAKKVGCEKENRGANKNIPATNTTTPILNLVRGRRESFIADLYWFFAIDSGSGKITITHVK